MKNIEFFHYQENAIEKALKMPFFALFFKPGRGKTVTTLAIAEEKFKDNQFEVLVIVTTKKIIGFGGWQAQINKYSDLAEPFIWSGSKSGTKKFWEELKVYMATAKPFPILMVNVEAFQIWHSELMRFLDKIEKKSFYVVDECFVAGTMVDCIDSSSVLTPRPIQDIVPGDMILNAIGVDYVSAVSRKTVESLVEISIDGRIIACSENHRFFTNNGWKAARYLCTGDFILETGPGVRFLRTGVLPGFIGTEDRAFLWNELFCEMADVKPFNKEEGLYRGKKSKDISSPENILFERVRFIIETIKKNSLNESHAEQGEQGENDTDKNNKWNPQKSTAKRRERNGNARSREVTTQNPWWGLGYRVCCIIGKTCIRVSNELQARFSIIKRQNRNRGGWKQPLQQEGVGQEKGCKTGFSRVEGVKVHKQGSPFLDKYRDADGQIYCYDIKALQHQSFSVNGLLVHNCTKIKNISRVARKPGRTRNLMSVTGEAPVKAILSGTPRPKSIIDLWAPFEFLKDRFWKEVSLYIFEATYTVKMKFRAGDHDYDKIMTDYDVAVMKEKIDSLEQLKIRSLKQEGFLSKLRFEHDKLKSLLEETKRKEANIYAQIEPYTFYAPAPERVQPVEEELVVDLTTHEKKAYKEMKNHMMTMASSGEMVTVAQKSALFHKFRQITGGSLDREHDIEGTPSKLSALLEEVSDHEEKVIICSAYVRNIERIAKALESEGVVTFYGETSDDDVSTALERFSSDAHRFFVCNPTVASHGLDGIQRFCRQMIFYDLPITPSDALEQVRARIDREGQQEQCIFKHITAKGTVDERVLGLIADREDGQRRFERMNFESFLKLF